MNIKRHVDGATIEILFCANPGYYEHVAVAAVSLAENNARSAINIHVLTCDAEPVAEAWLSESLLAYHHVALSFHYAPAARLGKVFVDQHLTKEAYLRLLAPDIFPVGTRRVLYLDSDLVVLDDIEPLWNTDLRGKALAAAPDLPWDNNSPIAKQAVLLGLTANHTYVNSGVLLLDLERWRRDRISSRLFAYIEQRHAALLYHDQDAINAVCRDDIEIVDCRWNVQARMYLLGLRAISPAFKATRQARRHPAIVHYTTRHKPWLFRSQSARKRDYFHYRAKTAWRDANPAGHSGLELVEWRLGRELLNIGIDYIRLIDRTRHIASRLSRSVRRGLTLAWERALPGPTPR